jgi:hypothetical protein
MMMRFVRRLGALALGLVLVMGSAVAQTTNAPGTAAVAGTTQTTNAPGLGPLPTYGTGMNASGGSYGTTNPPGAMPLTSPSSGPTGITSASIEAGTWLQATQQAWGDPDALSYIHAVGLTDPDAISRVHSFVTALKGCQLWAGMDGLLLRTNFNHAVLRSLAGRYATNYAGVVMDGAGAHYDGTSGYTVLPTPVGASNTLLVIYAGGPGMSDPKPTPFGLFNTAGTNAGAIYPFGNNNTTCQMRWAISGNGSGESSSSANGWFADFGYAEGSIASVWLYGVDFRQRIWALTWDNAGNETSYIDGSPNLAKTGFVTRLTNGALNSLVVGSRLNATGQAEGFFQEHVQAAFVWPYALTSNQVYLARQAVQWLLPGDSRMLWVGDSMSAYVGPNPSFPYATGTDASHYWPAILYGSGYFGANLGDPQHSEFTPFNISMSGLAASSYPTPVLQSRFGPYAVGGPIKSAWCNVLIGVNDLGILLVNGPTAFASTSNIWWFARNMLGAKVRAFTLPNPGSAVTYNYGAGYWTNAVARSNFNWLVRSNPQLWDDMVDLDVVFPSPAMETNATPQWSYDGLHLTAAAQTNLVGQIKNPFRQGRYLGTFTGTLVDTNNLFELPVTAAIGWNGAAITKVGLGLDGLNVLRMSNPAFGISINPTSFGTGPSWRIPAERFIGTNVDIITCWVTTNAATHHYINRLSWVRTDLGNDMGAINSTAPADYSFSSSAGTNCNWVTNTYTVTGTRVAAELVVGAGASGASGDGYHFLLQQLVRVH